jgi:hypothetical protein
MFTRPIYKEIYSRLKEPRKFIQILAGPRQVGKTTLAERIMKEIGIPSHYVTADEPALHAPVWIEEQWEAGRNLTHSGANEAILLLDEIQKMPGWSETVKRLWDYDSRHKIRLKLLILGSSPLLIQKGLTESLAGRFEIIPVTHWSYQEMREAFGWSLEQYIYFGGYPGAAELIGDNNRWKRYIRDSIIETSLSRDIMLLNPIQKPALLRRLFQLGCEYSGKILTYQKMLGQLQDKGSTLTMAHYLELLSGAGMITGLQKYAAQKVRQRASSPKLQVLNNALISAQIGLSWEEAKTNKEYWGQLVESAVGAHLINSSQGTPLKVAYWREGDREVDFILEAGKNLTAIEVKSKRQKRALTGMDAFTKEFMPQRKLLVGEQGIALEKFLLRPASEWV